LTTEAPLGLMSNSHRLTRRDATRQDSFVASGRVSSGGVNWALDSRAVRANVTSAIRRIVGVVDASRHR